MCKVYERPPLVLSEGMKLFAVNAGYRKTDVGTNWYYVRAKNAREARKHFKDRITWLDVYGVREVSIFHPKKKVGIAKPIMMIEENNHESNKAIQ